MTKLLITGASGNLGQLVLKDLIETYNVAPSDIIAGSRDTSKLADWAAKGVETRTVDFDDENLAEALKGSDRLLLISAEDVVTPGRRKSQQIAAVKAAEEAGVAHIIYTSMPNPDDSLIAFAPDHHETEKAALASGMKTTILRNSWYMENMLGTLPPAIQSGQWFTSAGEGKVGYISREDCARAAAAALAGKAEPDTTYTLTGAEALSNAQIAKIVTEVTGKEVAIVDVTDEQVVDGMAASGMPRPVAEVLGTFDPNTREGKVDVVTSDFEKLTGEKPKSLKSFIEENKAALTAA